MKSILRQLLAVGAAITSLLSGVFWHLSAQDLAFSITPAKDALCNVACETNLSVQFNTLAAVCAVITGCILALALFIGEEKPVYHCNCNKR